MGVISGILRTVDQAIPDSIPHGFHQYNSGAVTFLSSTDSCPPFRDPASGCVAAIAGRLDNRESLRRLPGTSRDATDAELVAHAYLQKQERWPELLAGEFAAAVWDPRNTTLLLARDPLGFQPLYYSIRTGCFLFASFPEYLPQHPASTHELNEESALWYLYDGRSAPGRKTFSREIEFLPGGHLLKASRSSVSVSQYFVLPEEPPATWLNIDEAKEQLREKLANAISCRLKEESRVGSLLSGGVDSSSLTAMAARLFPGRVTAYSAIFDRFAAIDERNYSGAVTGMHSMQHVLVNADDCLTLQDFESCLPRFVDPFLTPYEAWQSKMLSRMQQDGCKAVLMGLAGDHLFNGSAKYAADWFLSGRWKELYQQMKLHSRTWNHTWLRSFAANALFPLLPSSFQSYMEGKRSPDLRGWLPVPMRSRVESLEIRPVVPRGRTGWWHALRNLLSRFGQMPFCHQQRFVHVHKLRLLAPFNDVSLVQLVLQVSPDCLYRNGLPKYLLREALQEDLPPIVRNRTTKASFGPLFYEGMRLQREWLEALLEDSELARRGFVEPRAWQSDLLPFIRGKTPPYWAYWRSLMLELWLRSRANRLPPQH